MDDINELLFFHNTKWSEKTIQDILNGISWGLLFKRTADLPCSINDVVLQLVYGNMRAPPGSENSPCQKLLIKPTSEDEEPVMGIWAPPDSLTKALGLKIFFPNMTAPFKLPDEIPVPPHLIMGYDAYKARDVMKLINKYPGEVLAVGFFTSDKPGEGQLIAKNLNEFEARPTPPTYEEKMVIQISKTNLDCLIEFLELNPSYKSVDAVEGEIEAKYFFPLGYNIPVKIKEEIKKKVKRKGKKAAVVTEQIEGVPPTTEGEVSAEQADDEKVHEEETLIGDEGEIEDHESGDEDDEDNIEGEEEDEGEGGAHEIEDGEENNEGEDKATSPMPDKSEN